MKFYKRDPDRALAGMSELTLKQRGAYNSLIDLLYARDGDVPDDDVRVAKMITCHWREWATLKRQLIELGKVRVEGGKILANRVQETLKEASDFSQEQSRRASGRWTKSKNTNQNNDPPMPHGNALTPTPTPIDTPRINNNKQTHGSSLPVGGNKLQKLADAFGVNIEAHRGAPNFIAQVVKLETEGIDFELDLLPAIRAWVDRGHFADEVNTLAYFRAAAIHKRAERGVSAEINTPAPPPTELTPEQWLEAMKKFLRSGYWQRRVCGPLPTEAGCLVPKDLLDRAEKIWNDQRQEPTFGYDQYLWEHKEPVPFFGSTVAVLLPQKRQA